MSSYDRFAREYSESMAEEGDFHHRTSIDPPIYSLIGNPTGKYIYDLGCGNGYMARKLAKKGSNFSGRVTLIQNGLRGKLTVKNSFSFRSVVT